MGKLNIIVAGATGYTGKIVCKYLRDKNIQSWGIAGRNEQKLNDLCSELSISVPVLTVDFSNSATLDAMCHRAVCIISCAGPFTEVGMPIVDACIRCQTHYIDSTGEFNFVRKVAEKYHQEAIHRGIVMVSCCGFDSTPSDIGNYVVHKEAGEPVKEVRGYIRCATAGMSSGTAHSIGAVMEAMEKPDLSPKSLVPADAVQPAAAPTRKGVWYDRQDKKWSAPFLMAGCNERVVRRSNALRGSPAVYVEAAEGSMLSSIKITASMYAMFTMFLIRPLRHFVLNKFYTRGIAHGPSEEKKVGCSYTFTFMGTMESGKRIEVQFHDDREMYDVTGLYLVECALSACALHEKGAIKPGVLTPSVAFGDDLVERLKATGIRITSSIS
eukprot:gene8650-6077_t